MIVHQYQTRDWIFGGAPGRSDNGSVGPRVVANNAIPVQELVLRDLGIGLMPDIMCLYDVASGAPMRIDLGWNSRPLLATATFLARRYTPAKTRLFLDHLAAFPQQRITL